MKKGMFENHPPSPSLPLKKGLHLSLGSLSSGEGAEGEVEPLLEG